MIVSCSNGNQKTVSHPDLGEPVCQQSGIMGKACQSTTEPLPSQTFPSGKLSDFIFGGTVPGNIGDFFVIALGQVGGDLREGDFSVGGAQNGITVVRTRGPGNKGHGGKNVCLESLPGQTGHDIVRRHIDAVGVGIMGNVAINICGRNQIAQIHRGPLGMNGQAVLVALVKPIVGGRQIHQIVQFLQSGIAIAAIGTLSHEVTSDRALGDNHIRQEEIAEKLAVLYAHRLQNGTHQIADVDKTAGTGAAGNAGKNMDVDRLAMRHNML